MPLDPHAKRFLDMMAAAGPRTAAADTIETRRKAFARLMALAGPGPALAHVVDEAAAAPATEGTIPLRVYTPRPATDRPLPAIIYFHGGGLVAGSLDTHDTLCRVLAEGCDAIVIAVGYRLAPEHKFPAAVTDAAAATDWVSAHATAIAIDPERIAVAGDSGGGTLAAIVCQGMRSRQSPPIALQLLLCPVLDFGAESASRRDFAEGYLLDRVTLDRDFAHYSPGNLDRMDPLVSPLRAADVAGVPPALIHTAAFDPLRDEGAAYAERLRQAGVPVRYTCHAGMIHHFYGLTSVIPAARQALDAICREMRTALAGASQRRSLPA
jgi:acetyl esterase/lipase